jgi:Tfp pilus assembly protein PilF
VIYDTTGTVIKDVNGVLGYYSWGSNDPAIHDRHFNLKFVNGALAAEYVSSDARTLNEPPSDWKIGRADDPTTYYAGSAQSLIGDLIRDGVTGVAGHVAEPFLDATIRPNILFPAYLSGANLAEAFYQAMPYLSWQTVVIGDPLCAPFRTTNLSATEIDKGLDPTTEMPQFFSAAHLKVLTSPLVNEDGVDVNVIKLLMRADARQYKRDFPAVRQILEEATAREKRLIPATISLALMYEQSGEYDKAIERYRTVLEAVPNNVVVLNNLAYALAVRKNLPQEALPLAEKAYALVPRNASLSDTLAWVLHLGGNDRRASGLLAEAIQLAPQNAEMHLHAAIVHSALGENDEAQQELAKALQLDAKLATDPNVQQLRTKLKLP